MQIALNLKKNIQNLIWPLGGTALIRRGYLKGYKFQVSENSGWSPILGSWEPECQAVFANIIFEGSTIFDLGANNGIHSLLFSKLVGTRGQVIAFEPLAENVREVEKNCELNNINNIRVIKNAIGKENGKLSFFFGHHNKQGSLIQDANTQNKVKITVEVITLDSFIEKNRIIPDFIKIDIEGAESDALVGFSENIQKIQPIMFIELHNPEQDKKVGEFLQLHHYLAFRINKEVKRSNFRIPYIEQVTDLNQTYPNPNGMWGTILAIHETKLNFITK